jgi:hypothetical protein
MVEGWGPMSSRWKASFRVLLVGGPIEFLTSFFLWIMAPTDGIRIWYSNVMTYAFQHIFVWLVVLAVLLGFMSVIDKKLWEAGPFRAALLFVVSDALASCLVWWISPVGSRPWPVATLWLYLTARWIWFLAASVAILLPYISFQARRRLFRRRQA